MDEKNKDRYEELLNDEDLRNFVLDNQVLEDVLEFFGVSKENDTERNDIDGTSMDNDTE